MGACPWNGFCHGSLAGKRCCSLQLGVEGWQNLESEKKREPRLKDRDLLNSIAQTHQIFGKPSGRWRVCGRQWRCLCDWLMDFLVKWMKPVKGGSHGTHFIHMSLLKRKEQLNYSAIHETHSPDKENTRAIHQGNDGLQTESGHLQSHFVVLEHYTKNLRSSFRGLK